MSDSGTSVPLQRALRMEEMVIAASAGSYAEGPASQANAQQDVAADVQASPNDTSHGAPEDQNTSQQPDVDAKDVDAKIGPHADADRSVDASLQASLQAIRDSLDHNSHSSDTTPSGLDDEQPHLVHASGTQIMPLGDTASGPHLSMDEDDSSLLRAPEHVDAGPIAHPVEAALSVGSLAEATATVLQTPMPLIANLSSPVAGSLTPATDTVGHVVDHVVDLANDAVATVPSLQGAGIDALTGLLSYGGPGSGIQGAIGGEVHAVPDYALLSQPIGLDDAHLADSGMLHGLHTSLPHAGSGLI